jgi:hypothetical protein
MNRREFCVRSMSALFMSDLLAVIVRGLITDAYAATTAISPTPLKNYVCLWMSGGAERVWFDAILTPNGSADSLGQGANVYTARDSTGANWEYKVTDEKVNGKYHLPHLWNSILPTANGGTVPMKSLAANTAIIRGVHTGLTFDAHGQNAQMVQFPFPTLPSVLGSIADNTSNSLIPAITAGHSQFVSLTNKSASSIGPGSNAEEIFKALKFENRANSPYGNAASAKLGSANLDKVVSSFITSLAPQESARKNKAIQILMADRTKAIQLLEKGFAGIRADYDATFAAYSAIIAQVMKPTPDRILAGLDDKPLKGNGIRFRSWEDQTQPYNTLNLIDGFNSAECSNMAHGFAKAEVFLRNKITNCIHLDIAGISKIANDYTRDVNNPTQTTTLMFDMHYTGDHMRGIAMSRYYQALAACLVQFKAKLTALPGSSGGNMWGETVVHLRSEINRGGSTEGGTHHSIYSLAETFFSGAIQEGPIVAGNIEISDNGKTNGNGAPLADITNQIIDSKFIYSTVGSLMGFPQSANHKPILVANGSKIVSNVAAPKNIKKAA